MESNFANLAPLTAESSVELMQRRFEADEIYTAAYDGSKVMVAVNPLKIIPRHRGYRAWQRCDRNVENEDPNVYHISAGAMRRIDSGRMRQAMIVSGCSGAGKTETTKMLLEHLAKRNEQSDAGSVARGLAANPILEAFGNASTEANENSSRFGKLIDMYFDESNSLRATVCKTFLFERSRVTNRLEGERNFHIFYQLLAGVSREGPRLKYILGMLDASQPNDFAMLRSSTAMDPQRDFLEAARTLRALACLEMSYIERMNLMKALAAILHAGNLVFANQGVSVAVDMSTRSSLSHVGRLLGFNDSAFVEASFCDRMVNVRGESILMKNTVTQAQQARDAFCRELYYRVFSWLVESVNNFGQSTLSDLTTNRTVTLLDVMGFEVQETNSLEQLLINYANERLQFTFSKQMIYQVQDEYLTEGLFDMGTVPPNVHAADDATLIFFENPNKGLFALLEQECFVPGGSDAGLVRKLSSVSRQVQVGKLLQPTNFIVKHYAGPVEYCAQGILEKNQSALSKSVASLLEYSTLVSKFTCTSSSAPLGGPMGRNTIGGKFKLELDALLLSLERCDDIAWIRCIRPNATKTPGEFDPILVKKQLQASGIVPAVLLARQGLPNHMKIADFNATYDCILPAAQDAVKDIRFGKTKAFMSDATLRELRSLRLKWVRGNSAIQIQSVFRAYRQRRQYLILRQAAQALEEAMKMKQLEKHSTPKVVKIEGILLGQSFLQELERPGELSSISSVATMDSDDGGDVVISEETSFILAPNDDAQPELARLRERCAELERKMASISAELEREISDQRRITEELRLECERMRQAKPPVITKMCSKAHVFSWMPEAKAWKTLRVNPNRRDLFDFVGPLAMTKPCSAPSLCCLNLLPRKRLLMLELGFARRHARIEMMQDWVLDQLTLE